MSDDLIYRLRKRAEIRRQITTRKSVQEGEPDRIADLLDEAANHIQDQYNKLDKLLAHCPIGECGECAKIICPYGDDFHFHHDGCPTCAEMEYENENTKRNYPTEA